MNRHARTWLTAAIVLMLSACSPSDQRPNVLLIVADDLGYTDISPYGSEIETPTLETLAAGGVVFSQFYTSPMCSPTRAMLITGIDNHRAGLGNLRERMADNQRGQPGYEGYLAPPSATLSERLKSAGYRTYMAGKWHLGEADGADPASVGFDRHFALHDSGASHYADMMSLSGPEKAVYTQDGEHIEALPDDFYSTRFYTDKLMEFFREDDGDERPFFAYLAYTAPHFPLHAPNETIAKFAGRYDQGYESIAASRRQRAAARGLIGDGGTTFPGTGTEPGWDELSEEERRIQARVMEIYAAMIDELDSNIGRLLAFLGERGLRDNTLIVFMSDNGAEGHRLNQGMGPLHDWSQTCCDNTFEQLGLPGSYPTQGPQWASVSVSPFRMFKGFTSEGGIRVPAIMHLPGTIEGGLLHGAIATVMDVAPTILDIVDVQHVMADFDGESLLAVLGDSETGERVVGWELIGKRALRQGDWKIVHESPFVDWWDSERLNIRRDGWQLYNLADDPAELIDRAQSEPERLAQMIRLWEEYAARNGVIPPDRARNY